MGQGENRHKAQQIAKKKKKTKKTLKICNSDLPKPYTFPFPLPLRFPHLLRLLDHRTRTLRPRLQFDSRRNRAARPRVGPASMRPRLVRSDPRNSTP
jgi:hypothetical protein